MKIAQFKKFGKPKEVVSCVDVAEPGDPEEDEVVIEIDAFPINPADLLTLSGDYAGRPPLPATLGTEGVGRIVAVGQGVDSVSTGDLVLPLGGDNWVQRKKEKASLIIRLPDMDTLQAAMLKVNPATAWFLLNNYKDLAEGDMVIQNAANSGVGLNLIKLAEMRGIQTINIVRRESLVPLLKEEYGASEVLVSGPDIVEQVAQVVGGRSLKLGIDAIGGESTRVLSKCLNKGGTVVNYGLLSGRPCVIDPRELVFRGITLIGFWLANVLSNTSHEKILEFYSTLTSLVNDGTFNVPVEKTYPIERIKIAVEHAGRARRDGKIIVLPNG